ncbi:lactoylglutathione lyase [Halogranum amylolyticum]|uniref:Lactoylglutathione lyase n=1 Tax=Halogranum amylolyticum TaxID=660520 RepID=A0A1H8SH22_9EURY|nr:VOC family protein [Halogranum amylolyticum]SEO77865.1 lactoylglutathione lyase [Halogranum amylolyticum]
MSLLHAAIDVTDMEATSAFYGDVLGFEPVAELEAGGVTNVFYGHGDEMELQFVPAEGEVDPSGLNHLAVDVDDVDALVEELGEDRVERGPFAVDEFGLYVAFVTDPDGYVVEVIQPQE